MTDGATGNAEEIGRLLMNLANAFDLTEAGANGSFAEDLLDAYAVGVIDRTLGNTQAADGSPLEPNQGKYADLKAASGEPVGVGLGESGTDRMLSLLQIKGERTITPDLATSTYGVSQAAKDKGNWFTYGSTGSSIKGEYSGATNQPERPFWGFDAEIEASLTELCDRRLKAAMESL